MTKYIAAAAIAIGLTFAAPAQAHCPNACSTGWHVYTASQLGVPATGTVTDATIRTAVSNSLNRYNSAEYLITTAVLSQSRTSSTSGWAFHIADYGWRYTPARITWLPFRYVHQCQADRGQFAAGSWRVRCTYHGLVAH
jgi:hypothetical protein